MMVTTREVGAARLKMKLRIVEDRAAEETRREKKRTETIHRRSRTKAMIEAMGELLEAETALLEALDNGKISDAELMGLERGVTIAIARVNRAQGVVE